MNAEREDGFEVGASFGAWRVEALIGEEADAVLAAVGHREDGTRGVLKLVRRKSAKEGDTAARFSREARALRAVAHAHVVPILDSGRMDDGRPWLVRAQIAGETLREALAARGKLPPGEAWRVARALLEALAMLHSLGVVHRSIAPGHILLEPREGRREPRLFGFGFRLPARSLKESPYAAPELGLGGGVDARADLFSVGMTLAEMLAGVPVRPDDLEATVPRPFAAFLVRLAARDPSARFANAWAAREAGDEAFAAFEAAATPADGAIEALDLEEDTTEAIELDLGPASEPLAPPGPPPPAPALAPHAPEVAPPPIAPPGIELDLGASSAPLLAPPVLTPPAPPAPQGESTDAAVPEGTARPRSPPPSIRPEAYLPRYFATHAAIAAAGLVTPIALGYAGASPHDVVAWFRTGGLSMVPITLAFIAAGVVIPRIAQGRAMRGESGHRAFALAFGPLLLATLGTGAAWTSLRETITPLPPMEAFTTLLAGAAGALAPRFWGFALGAAAFLMVLAMPLRRFRDRRFSSWRAADVAAIVLGAGALAGLATGATSGAFVAAVGAGACALGRGLSFLPTPARFREATDHAIGSVTATILAIAAAVTRLDARTAGPFLDATATRAERIAAIDAAAAERSTSGLLAALTLAVVVGVSVARLARIRGRMGSIVLPRSSAVLLLALPAFFAFDLAIGAALPARRVSLATEIAPTLELLAALDPPPARVGAEAPATAPTLDVRVLQLTARSIAMDGLALARQDALDSPTTREVVVAAIARATSDSPPAAARPDLALAADRRAAWTQVRELLRLARQAGARRIEILLTRGGEAPIAPGRTPESRAVLRSDFVALTIEIGVAGESDGSGTFGDVVAEWQADAASGKPIVVGVGW